jgi:hypothetical protein
VTTALDQGYSYLKPSSCTISDGAARIELASSTGDDLHPRLWSGQLLHPRQDAATLLAVARVARVARTRFYTPSAMLAAELRAADPVVTAHGDRLRFESFSACAGAYARLDLDTSSAEAAFLCHGTTNVDFNMPMRSVLGRVVDQAAARLSVGVHEVELEADGLQVIERKVPLPARWIKGFAETQLSQARMALLHEVPAAEATRFLRSIPSGHSGHAQLWAVRSGKGLRLSATPTPTAVATGGPERLRILADLIRWARLLRVYGEEGGSSAWELVLADSSFVLVLSPNSSRGLSGEGGVLSHLTNPDGERAAYLLASELCWQSRLGAAALARRTGLAPGEVSAGLARLGAGGLVGYDLGLGAYFHRELPFAPEAFGAIHPRLRDAHRLVESSSVRLVTSPDDGTAIEAMVRSGDVEHAVRITGDGARCSCPWHGRHRGERGPCKHVLATRLLVTQRQGAGTER